MTGRERDKVVYSCGCQADPVSGTKTYICSSCQKIIDDATEHLGDG